MFRKIICTLGALATVVLLRLPAAAAEAGSIRIFPSCAGQLVMDGEVALYRVGEPEEGGYRVTDGLADWTIWEEELNSRELIDWLMQQEKKNEMTGVITHGGGAYFSGLSNGLYLVVQREAAEGYFCFRPFLVSVPEKNQWDIVTYPQIIKDAPLPDTSDRPAPIIGAMGIGFAVTVVMLMVDKHKE